MLVSRDNYEIEFVAEVECIPCLRPFPFWSCLDYWSHGSKALIPNVQRRKPILGGSINLSDMNMEEAYGEFFMCRLLLARKSVVQKV